MALKWINHSGAQTSDNNPAVRHYEQCPTREKRARERVEKQKEAAEKQKAAAEKEKALEKELRNLEQVVLERDKERTAAIKAVKECMRLHGERKALGRKSGGVLPMRTEWWEGTVVDEEAPICIILDRPNKLDAFCESVKVAGAQVAEAKGVIGGQSSTWILNTLDDSVSAHIDGRYVHNAIVIVVVIMITW